MAFRCFAEQARVRLRAFAAVIALLATLQTQAADIFVSVDRQGVPSYATQRLDSTYRPLPGEAAPVAKAGTGAGSDMLATIDRIARRHGVPKALVTAVVGVESNYNARAVSPKGARGAMQLMPQTARRYGVAGADLLDAQHNIDAGARHLKELLAHYHGNTVLALAAYNAGAAAVRRHGQRVPPFGETMLYVPSVLSRAASFGEPQ